MKTIVNKIILAAFGLFCFGGIVKVLLQSVALLMLNESLMTFSDTYFDWIYPLAALAGLACYLMSYFQKKER